MSKNGNWQAPSWLTDAYLQEVLKTYLNNEQVKITNVDIKPATSNGENYASVMSRIKVEYVQANKPLKLHKLTFIMKYSYESDPFIAKIISGYDVYNTEMKMYERILPQLNDILQEVDDAEKLFAKTLKVDYERSAIIFEDLSVQNYVLADRLVGLDEEHTRMALTKLAKFHAAAAVLNQRLNGQLEQFQRGILNRYTRAFGCAYEYLTETCANFAKNCPELGAYYYDKLMKLKPHIVDYGTQAYNSNPNHFFTLCHGDFWVNNIMMLYDTLPTVEKLLKDVLLIDFQFCNWSSPAVDLYYFFHTSLEPKLQLDVYALNKLVQYYHSILVDVLKKLKYNSYIPTLHEMHVQLEEGKILALTCCIANQPFLINNQCDDDDFHGLFEDDERSRNFRNSLYSNKRIQNNIKTLLPYFDQIGLLDVKN